MKKSMLLITALLAFTLVSAPTFATTVTYARMVGRIESYGGTNVAFGWLDVKAKIGESARVRAIWTAQKMAIIKPPPEVPFTFFFYAAKLVEASIVELNYNGYDFYISGLWNVYKVTFKYNGTMIELSIEQIVVNGTGELRVYNGWTDFDLDITGIDLLQGKVLFYCIVGVNIPEGDVTGPEDKPDGKVDMRDIARQAKAFGTMPGMQNFSFDLDYNFDFRLDMKDIAVIAKNFGQAY